MKNAFNFRPWMVLAVLLTYSLGTWAQSITLKGIVKDDFGESIIGASVLQKGTTNGTVTDLDGNFTLTVPNKNAVLVISFIGLSYARNNCRKSNSFQCSLKRRRTKFG